MLDHRKLTLATAAFAALILAVPEAHAAPIPAITNVSGGNNTTGNFSQTTLFAFQFIPAADILVTALGIYDTQGNGLAAEMRVGVFAPPINIFQQQELARVHLPAGTSATLIDGFRYLDLAQPLLLSAGQSYQISSIYFNNIDAGGAEGTRAGSSHTFDPILTNVTRRAEQSNINTDVRWVTSSFVGSTLGPNFLFEVVIPEPSTTALAGLALLTAPAFVRRRRG